MINDDSDNESESIECNCQCHEYIIYVSLNKENGPRPYEKKCLINLQFINLPCKHIRDEYSEEFLDDLGGFFDIILNYDFGIENVNGFVFALYDLEDGYCNDISKKLLTFRQHCERYCIKHEIPYIFINKSLLNISATLFATNLSMNIGDLVTVVHLTNEKSVEFDSENETIYDKTTNWITVIGLEWNNRGYKLINWQKFDEDKKSTEEIKSSIMGDKNFKKLIITADSPTSRLKTFRGMIKSKKRIIIENGYRSYLPDILIIIVKELRKEEINKFKIHPCSLNTLTLEKGRYEETWKKVVFEFQTKMLLPYEEIIEVNSYDCDYIKFRVKEENSFDLCRKLWNSNDFDINGVKCHAAKITIKIETDGFFTVIFKPIFGPYFRKIPPSITSSTLVKIRLCNYSSYIWVQDIGRLKDSDHETCFPMTISFYDEQICVGKKAELQKSQYPTFAVSHILHMIEMVTYGKEEYPLLFLLTLNGNILKKDKNGTLFVIFETFRGRRKTTPKILLAGFLKYLLDLATQNIGFEPENFEIYINKISPKIEEIKKEISASLKLLNIKNYCFVEEF